MNGKKALYKLGDIDFMQNESFLIAVYNKDNFMLVSDPQEKNSGNFLPMRQQIDSLLGTASQHYNIAVTDQPLSQGIRTSTITMVAIDSLAQFRKFEIVFDKKSHYLSSVHYSFMNNSENYEDDQQLSDSTRERLLNVPRKNMLTIYFTKYRFDNISSDIYNENNYIFLEDNVYKPVSKYADFKLYNSRTKK